MKNFFVKLAELEKNNQKFAWCVITDSKGSTPRKPGAKMIVLETGEIFGTIGGGFTEKKVIELAQETLKDNQPKHVNFTLHQTENSICGGEFTIFIEPILTRKKIFIFGAGHVGKNLAICAYDLNFDVTLIDEREEFFHSMDEKGLKTICKNYNQAFKELIFDNETFIVCVSHLHSYDQEIVAHCLKQPHAYLGMMGSRQKIDATKSLFLEKGIANETVFEGINWPIGIPIQCETPDEIVISILAKIIDVRSRLNSELTKI